MFKPHHFLHGIALAAAMIGMTACQTTQTAPDQSRFNKADKNKDGKLSPAEVSDEVIVRLFESRDTNHDGKVTWAEWNVQGAGVDKARFNARDTNKDGAVSLAEALAYGSKHPVFQDTFRAADTNKDGFLTLAEAQSYYASKEGPPN